MRVLYNSMNGRFLLIFCFSIAIHFAVLAIDLSRHGAVVVGVGDLVRLVSGNADDFAPNVTPALAEPLAEKSMPLLRSPQLQSVLSQPIASRPLATAQASASIQPERNKATLSALDVNKVAASVPSVPASPPNIAEPQPVPELDVSNSQAEVAGATLLARPPRSAGSAPRVEPFAHAVPRYADNPRPDYPTVARRNGWEGKVRLLVNVSVDGEVDRISVSQSSGYAVLDRAARRAVRRWRFIPALEVGRKVASEVLVPIEFRLPVNGDLSASAQE